MPWAAVHVLLAVLTNPAAVQALPGLHGVVDLVAFGAPGQRSRTNVDGGQRHRREDDVEPVAPLRGVRVGVVADVGRGHRDELVVVTHLVHRGQPDVEQLPGRGLDDVLDEDDLVAVNFGGSHNIPERGAGAVQRGRGNVALRFEQRELGGAAAGAAGGGEFGADRGRPEHIGVGHPSHVVVGHVGDQVVGVGEVQGVGLDGFGPVVCTENQGHTGVFEADAGAAESAEDVGVSGMVPFRCAFLGHWILDDSGIFGLVPRFAPGVNLSFLPPFCPAVSTSCILRRSRKAA